MVKLINHNFISKLLVIVLFFPVFLSILSGFVSAGCCILGGGCVQVPSEDMPDADACSAIFPSTYNYNDCNMVEACIIGCCCFPGENTGVGTIMDDCTGTFVAAAIDVGEPCTCGGATFSVSGAVADTTGQPLSGATVSAGGRSDLTDQYGGYSIAGVPEGSSVLVTASLGTRCSDSSVSINLNQDMTNVNFILNCVCNPGACNINDNAFCNLTTSAWHFFDISIPSQRDTYCAWCGEYDISDCPQQGVCITGDGLCPAGCTYEGGDLDCPCVNCHPLAYRCGDGIVTYPYETCEPEEYIQEGQLSRCSPSVCPPPGSIAACNCQVASECGNGEIQSNYGEQCEIGMLCPNGVPCNENCQCGSFTCNGTRINPRINASYDSYGRRINVWWEPYSSCLPLIYSYALYRCENSTSNPKNCGSKAENFVFFNYYEPYIRNIYDSTIYEDSKYCYYVQAFYGDPLSGTVGESNITCQNTGNSICMEPHTQEFCLGNVRYRCAPDNTLQPIPQGNCEAQGKHCMGPDRDGITNCTDQDVCDECNGLYGMFSNLDLRVGYDNEIFYCLPGGGRSVIPGCYLDRTTSLFSEFKYCSDISSCYDYKSQQACDDPDDPCGKNKGCEWAWMFGDDNNNPPLNGIFGGICRPNSTSLQRCGICDDPLFNWLSTSCNPYTCELFGDCFYQGLSLTNPYLPTCTSASTFSCRNYNNPSDCTGITPASPGRAVSVDVIYDSTGERIGGTHALTTSNDARGLGKCFWDSINSVCTKNADNYPEDNDYGTNLAYGYDCARTDTYCEADFSNPITTILPTTSGAYPANMRIRYTVVDNYPTSTIHTYFCINQSGSCYPNELPTAIGNYTQLMTQSGEYNLYYYSQDPAKNLEPVKHIIINVDADRPSMQIYNCLVETGTVNFTISGTTSTDARWLCFNNSARHRVSCINNCALTNQVQPCIDNATGAFSINITIQSTPFTQIFGMVEDFAGNTYQNTLEGICLGVDPPSDANITIKAMGAP